MSSRHRRLQVIGTVSCIFIAAGFLAGEAWIAAIGWVLVALFLAGRVRDWPTDE